MKIEGKLEISNVDDWTTNWEDDVEKRNELEMLVADMRNAIHERCGIDISHISIELKIEEPAPLRSKYQCIIRPTADYF